jgi:hypothetical protein
MKKFLRLGTALAAGVSLLTPALVFAQGGINLGAITPYSTGIINLINQILVPVLMAIAFIVFLWGIYKYFILGAANEEDRANGRQFALWGVLGFVVILSLWGLVNLTRSILGLDTSAVAPAPPTFGASQTSGSNARSFPGSQTTVGGTVGGVTPAQQAAAEQAYAACAARGDNETTCNAAYNAALQSTSNTGSGNNGSTGGAAWNECVGLTYGNCAPGTKCEAQDGGEYACVSDASVLPPEPVQQESCTPDADNDYYCPE